MKKAAELGKIPTYMGIDTWGVDFVLLDKNGNLIATQNGGFIKKFSAASIAGGSAQPVCTILSPTNDNAFNFECAQISATDKVYFSAGPNGAVLPADQWSRQGGLFRAEIDGATGDVNALQISRLPEFRMFQAAFAMTDNYAVVATLGFSAGGNEASATKPGVVYVRKTDDTLAPNTWAYIGGDPCSTKNVKVVYGSY